MGVMEKKKYPIAEETAKRVNDIIDTDDFEKSLERKNYLLGEIAILIAGILDALERIAEKDGE